MHLQKPQKLKCYSNSHCGKNEICFLFTKTCECDLTSVNIYGICKPLQDYDKMAPTYQSKGEKIYSSFGPFVEVRVKPYWAVTAKHYKNGNLLLGNYNSGKGSYNNPMLFTKGGSRCGSSSKLELKSDLHYACYCSHDNACEKEMAKLLSPDTYKLIGWEYSLCQFQFIVFTPLACAEQDLKMLTFL